MGNLCCCSQVDQSTVAIMEHFGEFSDVLKPGCHCMPWVCGYQIAGHLSLKVQQLDVKCETKTKDNVFVNVVASVQYRVLQEDAHHAFYRLQGMVPKFNLDAAFERKDEIAKAVEDELAEAMTPYGYVMVQTLIVDIEPNEHVKRVMNETHAVARLRMEATEKAETEMILQIKRAQAEAETKSISGFGVARQRKAILEGFRDSLSKLSDNMTAKDAIDMLLVMQYFDTMKEIGASSKSSAVFIPHGPDAVHDVTTQIRERLLQGSSAQQ